MSRVQVARGVIPKLAKDSHELEIWYTGNGSDTFDPTFTTSISTRIAWLPDDSAGSTTNGTSHAFSYVPSAGLHRCLVWVEGGLRLVTVITADADNLVTIDRITRLRNLSSLQIFTNPLLQLDFGQVPRSVTTLNVTMSNTTNEITGDLSQLPVGLQNFSAWNCAALTGDLSQLPRGIISNLAITSNILITGDLSDIPMGTTIAYLFGDTSITTASIAHLTTVRDLRIYSMGWTSSNVDTVLLSASDAVWADANHFTYPAPSLQIGGTNAAPGGTAGAATTDPAVTPGNGNSNSDWAWTVDAGHPGGAHKALTGKAAIYYLQHLASHAWTITYT
jgi:hypothetical protein